MRLTSSRRIPNGNVCTPHTPDPSQWGISMTGSGHGDLGMLTHYKFNDCTATKKYCSQFPFMSKLSLILCRFSACLTFSYMHLQRCCVAALWLNLKGVHGAVWLANIYSCSYFKARLFFTSCPACIPRRGRGGTLGGLQPYRGHGMWTRMTAADGGRGKRVWRQCYCGE